MAQTIELESLHFKGIIKPGDGIVTSNGCGEALSSSRDLSSSATQ